LNYTISTMKDHILLQVSGEVNRVDVLSAASLVRDLDISHPETVVLDVDGLEDAREMFYHAAVINTIKKEIEHRGGSFRIRVEKESIRSYLNMTGLERLFVFDKPDYNIPEEGHAREFQRC